MITLYKDKLDLYLPKVSLAHILCLKAAFDGSSLEAEIWKQEENGETKSVIAKFGGRLYITSNGGDTAELKEFINVIGGGDIFTEKSTAEALGLEIEKEFDVLKLCNKAKPLPYTPDIFLKALYSALAFGEDGDISLPSFEIFAPDVSHRLRHDAAVAFADDTGGALAFSSDKCAVINGIAVKKEHRLKGNGSKLLKRLINHLGGDILVCAKDENIEFYRKNCFILTDKAVISKLY